MAGRNVFDKGALLPEPQLVEEVVGTAYDKVKKVADNIDSVIAMAEVVPDILTDITENQASALEAIETEGDTQVARVIAEGDTQVARVADLIDDKADKDLGNVDAADFADKPFAVQGGTQLISLKDRFRIRTSDKASLTAAFAASGPITLPDGVHASTVALGLLGLTDLKGEGRYQSELKRTGAAGSTLVSANAANYLTISDLSIDMNFRGGFGSGHGVSIAESDDVTIRNVRVRDFGNPGGGAGTGVLVYSVAGTVDRVVFDDIHVSGETATSTDTNGTLIVRGLYCRQSGIISGDIRQYAVEYKNDTRYSTLNDCIAYGSGYGYGYGQDTAGVDGCDLNVAHGLVAAACDTGFIIGEGNYNVISSLLIDSTGRPNFIASSGQGVRVESGGAGGGVGNWFTGVLTYGTNMTYPILTNGSRNVFEIASHDTAAKIASFQSGAANNHVHIAHPGARASVMTAIDDASGNATNGASANTVDSPHTREYIGSVSGKFHWKLASYGGTLPANQHYVFENNGPISVAYAVPGASTDTVYPCAVHTPAANNHALIGYQFAATTGNQYWMVKVGGVFAWRFFNTVFRPETDITQDIGSAGFRVKSTYTRDLFIGAGATKVTGGTGSPEGVVTAPVGSTWHRTDGGAGTTLYVKESGTGNTGWVPVGKTVTPEMFGATGDGATDDSTAMQAAINAAVAAGKPLEISKQYVVAGLTVAGNLEITGTPGSSLIKKANTDSAASTMTYMVQLTSHDINVRVSGVLLDGNEVNQPGYEPRGALIGFAALVPAGASSILRLDILNCRFRNSTIAAVWGRGYVGNSNGREHVTVKGCTFEAGRMGYPAADPLVTDPLGYAPDAICLTDGVHAEIVGNLFVDNKTATGTQVHPQAIRATYWSGTTNADGVRLLVSGNTFKGWGRATSPAELGVVDVYGRGRDVRIVDNVFEDPYCVPIRGKTNTDMLLISGNMVTDSNWGAIQINPATAATQVGDITVSDNQLKRIGGISIYLAGDGTLTPKTARVNVSGNIISATSAGSQGTQNGDGIYCSRLRNVNIHDNILDNIGGSGIGVRVVLCDDVSVTGNQLATVAGYGVQTNGCSGLISISHNKLRAISSEAIYNYQMASGGDFLSVGNQIDGGVNYGIFNQSPTGTNTFTAHDNAIRNITGSGRGIYVDPAVTHVSLVGNKAVVSVATPVLYGGTFTGTSQDHSNTWNPGVVWSTAAPTTGTHARGEIVWNSTPSVAGVLYWRCTTAGSPGTWEAVSSVNLSDDVVTNAKLANMATGTVKARLTALTGDPEDVTLAQLKTALGLTWVESGELAVTGGTIVDFTHSLGAIPKEFHAVLRNKVTEGGYAVGDEIHMGWFTATGTTEAGISVYADATKVYARIAQDGLTLLNASGVYYGNGSGLTPGNWRVVLRARA